MILRFAYFLSMEGGGKTEKRIGWREINIKIYNLYSCRY